ncbi:MAG TPA: glutathione S-transferase N-terminal domain-containing protein [Solirubrobacter sp.]|nr:glutathione S-transferase N-terminal domain-containing protein [Solirubrobacter sp.]
MHAKLIGTVGSHPCISAELMLRHKGIPYSRVDLPNITHKAILPLLRYRGTTVPVMNLDGRRISGTMKIARALEAAKPDPPMFPADEADEAWADAELQDGVRQLARWATGKDKDATKTFMAASHLPLRGAFQAALPVIGPVAAWQMRRPDEVARAALAALPAQLDRVDAMLAEDKIGGERPNAVDFQVAPSVRLMLCFDQLREPIDARPAGHFARRLVPDYPGRFKAVFPTEWMPF